MMELIARPGVSNNPHFSAPIEQAEDARIVPSAENLMLGARKRRT